MEILSRDLHQRHILWWATLSIKIDNISSGPFSSNLEVGRKGVVLVVYSLSSQFLGEFWFGLAKHNVIITYIVNISDALAVALGFVEDVKTSDHKPLFASFDVGIIPQTVSPKVKSPMSGGAQILFQEITAEVKTRTRDIFRVSFYSRCLDGMSS